MLRHRIIFCPYIIQAQYLPVKAVLRLRIIPFLCTLQAQHLPVKDVLKLHNNNNTFSLHTSDSVFASKGCIETAHNTFFFAHFRRSICQ